MPQLSPMSWVMVICVFLVCFIWFSVMLWWVADSSYGISFAEKKVKVDSSKKQMKWSFGSVYLK
uniref:ATP synthase F0 subunit 8 n=1 Tax=Lepidodesma languilati TaxID=1798241 RepID=A0A140CQ34_9BIVA|nr:ATP synthase F0 subunit 8 [Lepidodesma languilati]AMH85895.1 ATP synthase F0 subunit 8 [Lepidodesma languilati]